MKLKLKDTRVIKLTKYPKEPHTNQVLELTTTLTPPVAEKFRCREACYTDEGVPRTFESYPSPAVTMNGADVTLGDLVVRAKLIHKFKVVQPKTSPTDVTLELQMRAHFEGDLPISVWLDEQNKTPFVLGINARQEDLAFGDEEEGDVEEEAAAPHDARQETLEGVGEPAIASARAAAGGTHQRRRGGNQVN